MCITPESSIVPISSLPSPNIWYRLVLTVFGVIKMKSFGVYLLNLPLLVGRNFLRYIQVVISISSSFFSSPSFFFKFFFFFLIFFKFYFLIFASPSFYSYSGDIFLTHHILFYLLMLRFLTEIFKENNQQNLCHDKIIHLMSQRTH